MVEMKAQTKLQNMPPADTGGMPQAVAAPPKVTAGRIVNFVLKDGQVRPLMIVRVWGDSPMPGYINGVLLFDGSNDANVLPHEVPNPVGVPVMWVTSVHYDAAKVPGTWHWPERV